MCKLRPHEGKKHSEEVSEKRTDLSENGTQIMGRFEEKGAR